MQELIPVYDQKMNSGNKAGSATAFGIFWFGYFLSKPEVSAVPAENLSGVI
jgi:hypothetical protein